MSSRRSIFWGTSRTKRGAAGDGRPCELGPEPLPLSRRSPPVSDTASVPYWVLCRCRSASRAQRNPTNGTGRSAHGWESQRLDEKASPLAAEYLPGWANSGYRGGIPVGDGPKPAPSGRNGSYRPGKPLFDQRANANLRFRCVKSSRKSRRRRRDQARLRTKRTGRRATDCDVLIRTQVRFASSTGYPARIIIR